HWFFFAQPSPRPEQVINRDPDWWYGTDDNEEPMGAEAFADYRAAIHDPGTVHAMVEDYRAGLDIDRDHDAADRAAGRNVACPTLLIWAKQDDLEDLYGDRLAVWRPWGAGPLRGKSIACGHHIPEQAPDRLAAA